VTGSQASLWVWEEDGGRVRLLDRYRPDLFLEPAVEPERLMYMLEEKDDLPSVTVERRVSSIKDMGKTTVIRVQVDDVCRYRRVVSHFESSEYVDALYDVDMTHTQRYLCDRRLIPFARVEADVDRRRRLRSIHSYTPTLDEEPPPFRVLWFGIDWGEDKVEVAEPEGYLFTGGGALRDFLEYVRDYDPDILVCGTRDLHDLLKYSEANRAYRLGTLEGGGARLWKGRLHVTSNTYEKIGLAGVTERVQYTREAPHLASEWGSGRAIESRQCYEARSRGVLIPRSGDFQPVMTLEEMLRLDHGGLILTPDVGLHEDVGVLDFDSMFPSLMVKHNISYETVRREAGEGFVIDFTREALQRRLHYKYRRRALEEGSPEWRWCDGRQNALKSILFCTYGYSGCWANRFGNFDTFMEINRVARDSLVAAMNIAREHGYRAVYGNNDSLFLKRPGATRRDYEELARVVSTRLRLPMSVENVFRYLVLLPQKNELNIGAANRYYGRTLEGRYVYRGIEIRRRDTAPYVARVQREVIEALLSRGSAEEVVTEGVEQALGVLDLACRRIRRGMVPAEELRMTTTLRRRPGEYKVKLPHVAAAEALGMAKMMVEERTPIEYVYVDAGHSNRFRRVRPALYQGRVDAEKYVDLVKEAGRSVLLPFDADLDRGRGRQLSLTEFT
jgi:DNA polymerase elongation subunit (family B)